MGSHLIDSTEMYVRTVWELEEEGIVPIRARLSERLNLSAPSVSETVTRLEDEGLLRLEEDRTLRLTERGRELAVSVMRKHRLAERLLVDVVGLAWERVHDEACRWEHVISDEVEAKLIELLEKPSHCPHGNPIPGLAEEQVQQPLSLADAAGSHGEVRVSRISEQLQTDVGAMGVLARHGLRPGVAIRITAADGHVHVDTGTSAVDIDLDSAELIYVEPT